MSYEHLLIEEDGPIATVRLNRPDARNALSRALMRELIEAAQALRQRPDLDVIILTGGATFFSAGADLKDRAALGPRTVLERRSDLMIGPDLCQAWEDLEQITIAAVEGFCVGGGAALAASCDFRVCGEGASFRLPEVPLGWNMSWGSIPRLTALMGPARTKRFVLFGESLEARDAIVWGLADEVVPAGQAEAAARVWAQKAADLPPIPARMTKHAVNASAHALNHVAAFMDRDQFLLTSLTEDGREGARAFFEKRKGVFKGD